jgi:hypothetical protein
MFKPPAAAPDDLGFVNFIPPEQFGVVAKVAQEQFSFHRAFGLQ